jgi:hypothetical protein
MMHNHPQGINGSKEPIGAIFSIETNAFVSYKDSKETKI